MKSANKTVTGNAVENVNNDDQFPGWLALLLFHCAKTVSERDPFHPMNLPFERKQIPRIVVTIRNSRKPTEPLEPISLPWAQGVGRSNRPAPTRTKDLFLSRAAPIPCAHNPTLSTKLRGALISRWTRIN